MYCLSLFIYSTVDIEKEPQSVCTFMPPQNNNGSTVTSKVLDKSDVYATEKSTQTSEQNCIFYSFHMKFLQATSWLNSTNAPWKVVTHQGEWEDIYPQQPPPGIVKRGQSVFSVTAQTW